VNSKLLPYRDRAEHLRLSMQAIDDPVARVMLAALADAFDEAEAEVEEQQRPLQKPGYN
jgi:hypothetical protein